MYRRMVLHTCLAAVSLLTLLAPVAPVRADDSSTPSDTANGLGLTDAEIEALSIPPTPAGFPDGPRLYVRTNAVNSTEYLYIRAAITKAGFPDVLEVSPGSLVVAIGSASVADATARLAALRGVVEVVPAPAFDATEPVSYPSLPLVLTATVLTGAAVLVGATQRSRRRADQPAA